MSMFARKIILVFLVTVALMGPRRAHAESLAVTLYPLPSGNKPYGIAAGPDGALWFTEYAIDGAGPSSNGKIGRISTGGVITEYALPSPSGTPQGITAGPDGALWFVEIGDGHTASSAKIGRITVAGDITEFPIAYSAPSAAFANRSGSIAVGSDGALWFTKGYDLQAYVAMVGRITTDGAMSEFRIVGTAEPASITAGPDGALWLIEQAPSGPNPAFILRLTTSGASTQYDYAGSMGFGFNIISGPDGALWSTTYGSVLRTTTDGGITRFSVFPGNGIVTGPDGALWFDSRATNTPQITRLTTSGVATSFTSTAQKGIFNIVAGPDGALWFTDFDGAIGRFSVPPSTSALAAAVLPSARSVQVGASATAFATIINSGSTALSGCGIAPVGATPTGFGFQTTDPRTNVVNGMLNQRVSILSGQAQTFVVGYRVNAPFLPVDATLGFSCANADAAPIVTGVNTLLLSGAADPAPDIVAVAATSSNDGILDIPAVGSSGAFAVATTNAGAPDAIVVRVDTGAQPLPAVLTVCRTNPSDGQCVAAPSAAVTTTIASGETPTFSVFARSTGAIAFSPATARAYVRFADHAGVIRGAVSVALRTR